ncbi:hypothetical protein PRZ48_001936 [Zasmidium cellare]|uniref:Vacuolar membrane protein n=1 Tax=Zasmidium cellare TaxID=395010 RepID=A0ABR0F4I1_ZASCE|nr:hypothetical protein PRZ48_001936 [Zasmidium cellare]
MGCGGDREKGPPEEAAKWDYLTLGDFRCTSAWTYPAYVWLWFMAIVAVAVYVVDTYTAVNLLAFDNWSSQVKPAVPIKYSKWIFAVCILLSWVLCIYEWIRAIRVITRGGVAESFLDPLAVTLQSIRPQGFKRFLVFTELTKSRKGTDYVALFVYFAFKGAIRVIIAEGPRQVVNALTLKGLLTDDLLNTQSDERNSFDQFWYNVEQVADRNHMEAAIYCSMLFTLVIWVFSALSLIISAILYLLFLWHYIPKSDGRLSVYCKRKVDRRLAKIVEHKVQAAIEKEQKKAAKVEQREELRRAKTGELPPPRAPTFKAQPTLPTLEDSPDLNKKDQLPEFPLVRQDTSNSISTLPAYSSRPPTRNGYGNPMQRQPTLPALDTNVHPGMPPRSGTQTSQWSAAPSYATDAPLLANAGYAGHEDDMPAMPRSVISRQTSYSSFNAPFHDRNGSGGSMGSVRAGSVRTYTPGPGPRAQTPMSARSYTPVNNGQGGYPRAPPAPRIPLPVRSNTAFSYEQNPQSAVSMPDYARPPTRAGTAEGFRPLPQDNSDSSFSSLHSQQSFSRPMPGRKPSNPSFRAYTPAPVPEDRPASPQNSYEMKASPVHSQPQNNGYTAFNPSMHSTTPAPQEPRRNITVTGAPQTGDYFGQIHHGTPQRSATAPIEPQRASVAYAGDILDEYGSSDDESAQRHSNGGPPRAATTGPGPHGGQGQWRAY